MTAFIRSDATLLMSEGITSWPQWVDGGQVTYSNCVSKQDRVLKLTSAVRYRAALVELAIAPQDMTAFVQALSLTGDLR